MYLGNQARFRPPSLGTSLLLTLVLFAVIAFETAHYLNLKNVSQRYHSSPGCAAGSAKVDPSLPPCTETAYSVLQTYTTVTTHYSSRHTHYVTHWMVSLQATDGGQQTVELADAGMWTSLHQGVPVKVQFWQGRPRLIDAQGQTAPTPSNPDYQAQDTGWVLLVLVVLGVGILAFLVYGVIWGVRSSRMSGQYAPGFYPSGPTMAPASYTAPAMGLGVGAPPPNPTQGPSTIAGEWRGSWGPSNAQSKAFEAFFEVNNSGVIKGRFLEAGRTSESTIAGEQEGYDFRFFKRGLGQGSAEGVEFRGQIGPDGRSLYGTWHRSGKVLGILFKTAGNWSATRVAEPDVAVPTWPGPA